MNIIALFTATGCAILIFIVGAYERIYRMPKWFAHPPQSFELITPQAKKSTIFWIPAQLLFITALITAIITNWNYPEVRWYLLLAFACFAVVAGLTGGYFVPEILAFAKMTATTPLTPAIERRARLWLKWTTARNVLQAISLVWLIVALTKVRG